MNDMTNRLIAGPIAMPGGPIPVIALHCSGSTGAQWRGLADTLGGRFAVHAPDLLGTEAAGHWTGEHRFSLADEARPILDRLDASPVPAHLVGHSYGGGVALHVARCRPDRVASLSLYEPSAFHLLKESAQGQSALAEILALMDACIGGLARGDYRAAAARFVDYWNGSGAWPALRPGLQAALVRWLPKAPLDFRALIDEPAPLSAYRHLACPVLILRGQHAPRPTRLVSALLAGAVPDCLPEQIAGAGHMGPLTHAEAVNRLIADHITAIADMALLASAGTTALPGR